MSKITKFVVWICSKFSRQQVEAIAAELIAILKDANSRGPFSFYFVCCMPRIVLCMILSNNFASTSTSGILNIEK